MTGIDGERVLLEQEVAELRAREQDYRTRLAHSEYLDKHLRAHNQQLHRLFLARPPSHATLLSTLADVARISAQALDVRRTSIWTFDAEQTRLQCVLQLVDGERVDAEQPGLDCTACPTYVQALATDFALAVPDVRLDERMHELDAYLREHSVGALLDIPITAPRQLLGVVCHEFVGGTRHWHPREVDFATGVAERVALMLEAERRASAEQAQLGTEAKYKHLIESLPVTVYSFNVHTGKLDYVSPRARELDIRSAEQWLKLGASTWVEQIHPDDRGPVLERFARGAEGGFASEVVYRIRAPDGVQRWIRDTCGVVRDHAGEPVAIQGVLVDVTESVEADLARKEYERRYLALLENVDLLAVSLDTSGRVTFANEAFLHVTGFSREQVMGEDWFSLVLSEADRETVKARYLKDVARNRISPRFELDIVTRTGEVRRLLCTNTRLCAPDGTTVGASSLALDVTERRRLESEMLIHTKLESLGRLATAVAHDFNNLLTVMLGRLSLIKQRCAALQQDLSPHFGAMEQVLQQASELTRSLTTYGRREPEINTEKAALDDLITSSLPLLEAVAGKELSLETSLDAGGVRLQLNPGHMRQVLVNLVGNAADAMREHGSTIRISTHIELVEDREAVCSGAHHGGEFVVLAVADDGCGMDAATLGSAFDPFFTTKPDGRGTGLGLAITQTIVRQMRGFTRVESTPGKGTRFRLYLPVQMTPSRIDSVRCGAQIRRVLLVDHARDSRDSMAKRLSDAGYEVQSAADTRSAAELLAEDGIDLLITREFLPDGSGAVLTRSARSIHPELRAVVIASKQINDDSFDGVLVSPCDETTLLQVADAALRRAPPR